VSRAGSLRWNQERMRMGSEWNADECVVDHRGQYGVTTGRISRERVSRHHHLPSTSSDVYFFPRYAPFTPLASHGTLRTQAGGHGIQYDGSLPHLWSCPSISRIKVASFLHHHPKETSTPSDQHKAFIIIRSIMHFVGSRPRPVLSGLHSETLHI